MAVGVLARPGHRFNFRLSCCCWTDRPAPDRIIPPRVATSCCCRVQTMLKRFEHACVGGREITSRYGRAFLGDLMTVLVPSLYHLSAKFRTFLTNEVLQGSCQNLILSKVGRQSRMREHRGKQFGRCMVQTCGVYICLTLGYKRPSITREGSV